jgi:hypothetical protein
VVVEAPAHIQVVELGVLLSTSPHFVVDRDYFQRLRIDRKKRDSTRLRFELAVSDSDEAGPATVVAQFLYRGRPCGRVRREWSWPSGKELPLDEGPAGVPVHTDVQEPDLTVIITATGAGLFNCSIRAPELGGPEYSKPVLWDGVRDSAAGLVTKALAKLVDRRKSEQERRRALLKAGRTFWDAAPAPFQKTLWALIKAREARGAEGRASIYIASDEPLLPWEIMRPSRPRANQADEDRPLPLGVEFAIGRWVRGDATSPPPTLPVRDSFLIAASYDKEDDKLDPTAEKYALEKHFAGRQLDSANYDFLDDYLRQNTASLLHFVCHGGVEDSEPAIFLDGWAPCTSRDLRENTGIANVCGSRFPIIFLNACDAGQATVALGPGGSGFPKTLSELGARAIIAPVWPVTKTSAPQVAKEVYDRAAANPDESLAEILADLRSRSYENGPFDDSWAAYCLFGDPNGKLRRA